MKYEDALPLLGTAITDPHPTLTIADIDLELRTNPAATLWHTDESVMFLRVEDYENGERVLSVGPAAGKLKEILGHGVADVEALARDNDCGQVMIHAGRPEWASALKEYGYEQVAIVLRKVLD